MRKKLKRLIHLLSVNARKTTKQLGKEIRASQQSASYMLNKLQKEKYFINFTTVMDPVKFGLVNVLVLYDFVKFQAKTDVINFLKKSPYVVSIEMCMQGADIVVEYCVPNLSLFNKENKKLMHTFRRELNQKEVYPIVVKHLCGRDYLTRSRIDSAIIVAGDRNTIKLTELQKKMLLILQNNARTSTMSMVKTLKIDPKTVVKTRKKLEKEKVIRQYSLVLDAPSIPLSHTHVLMSLDYDNVNGIDTFIQHIRQTKNIIQIIKVIGDYDVLITIEKEGTGKSVLQELRKTFPIVKYKVIESEKIIKSQSIPDIILSD
jgi:Lrp/AsnC family transcriptional regulator, leucine-responsive regulatory protein